MFKYITSTLFALSSTEAVRIQPPEGVQGTKQQALASTKRMDVFYERTVAPADLEEVRIINQAYEGRRITFYGYNTEDPDGIYTCEG